MKSAAITVALSMIVVIAGATAAFAAVPTNDDRADATVIGSLPYTDSVDVMLATVEDDEPTCGGTNSVWYRYTAPTDGTLVATTAGSDFPGTVSVWEGSLTSMSRVGCNRSSSAEDFAVLASDAVAGQTYFIQVERFNRWATPESGYALRFGLHWQPTVVTTIDPYAWLPTARDGATMTGTLRCSEPVRAKLEVTATYGGNATDIIVHCNGLTRWEADVRPHASRPFGTTDPIKSFVITRVRGEDIRVRTNQELQGISCTRIGTVGDDALTGTSGRDRICSLAGDDVIRTFGGDDVVYGYVGSDTMDTGSGSDSVNAGPGSDTVELGNGNDVASGNSGRDRIYGEDGADRIAGNADPDELRGGPGSDTCIGGDGRDAYSSCETKR